MGKLSSVKMIRVRVYPNNDESIEDRINDILDKQGIRASDIINIQTNEYNNIIEVIIFYVQHVRNALL